jgi:hypothetical protein
MERKHTNSCPEFALLQSTFEFMSWSSGALLKLRHLQKCELRDSLITAIEAEQSKPIDVEALTTNSKELNVGKGQQQPMAMTRQLHRDSEVLSKALNIIRTRNFTCDAQTKLYTELSALLTENGFDIK